MNDPPYEVLIRNLDPERPCSEGDACLTCLAVAGPREGESQADWLGRLREAVREVPATVRKAEPICEWCDIPFVSTGSGPIPRWCSKTCASRSYRARRRAAGG